jgi:hypothetical protein
MALLSFPSNPVEGQVYPVLPLPGQDQYRWSDSGQTWRLMGTASGVVPGTYGSSTNVGQFTVDAQGSITFATNVPIASSAGGTVTQVGTGVGLTGGPITGTGVINLENTAVTPGSYTFASFTVDQQGRLTAASSGTLPTFVAAVTATLPLSSSGGSTPDLSLSASGVTAGSYTYSSVTVDSFGLVTSASSGIPPVTSITAGTGLSGGTITTTGTIALADTAVTAGTYTYSTVTVDSQGRLTSATSNTTPITCQDFDAKGDLLVGYGADSYGIQGIGTNGQVLMADSACSPGMKWETITQCQGTVTNVATGAGLSGGAITTTGTISLNQASPIALGGVMGIANASSSNVALGVGAGQALGSAVDNVAIGDLALSTGNGSCNVAIGPLALDKITGTRNVGVGGGALLNATAATNNVGVGYQALSCVTTGCNNTEIGANNGITSFYSPPFQVTTECNRLVLGSTATTNAYVQVAWTVVSDERDKTEVTALPVGLDFISKLEPISYRFKESRDSDVAVGPTRYGFSAQQVLETEGENPVVVDTEDLDKLKITDSSIIPILVQAIKELKTEIDDLKNRG